MKTRTRTLAASIMLAGLFLMPLTASAQPAAPADADLAAFSQFEQAVSDAAYRTHVSKAQWKAFCDRIEEALASNHAGLKQGAMRLIITHSGKLDVDRNGIFDLVRIYRNDDNDNMRRMAVVALGELQDAWSMDFLNRSIRFESTPKVRHTLFAVVTAYYQPEIGPAKVGS